ncbi:MAG: hypothetical protein H6664_01675 [Ardenticatenaceae bacterium]|nr:hypothetical protein [Ardenticatenaceae bacterium]MCB9003054.1 hypothetical protein [Ardenticatenaceae bacterium]
MAKHRDTEYGQELYDSLKRISAGAPLPLDGRLSFFLELGSVRERELRKMKKFRFQLLHRWLVEHIRPCRVADIGGGKGLLAYLLQQSGWQASVIDPVPQSLPDKYKDIASGARVRIAPTERVPHIDSPFETHLGRHFDLLIGMHAHGSNAKVIDAALQYGCGFVLFPCCVIDEPFYPPLGVSWLESVAGYAVQQGLAVQPFRLNFKGQNIGLISPGRCEVRMKDEG